MTNSFSAHNSFFKSKTGKPELFGHDGINFIKMFQHSSVYFLNKEQSILLPNHVNKGFVFYVLYVWAKFINKLSFKKKRKEYTFKRLFFLDYGRVEFCNGKYHSRYFQNFYNSISEDNRTIVELIKNKHFPEKSYDLNTIKEAFEYSVFDKNVLRVLKAYYRVRKNVIGNQLFNKDEMVFADHFFHLFLFQFSLYNSIFKGRGIKKLFFNTHYHNEGMILAAKINGIETIEIQHGLIAENDLYYVYGDFIKDIRKDALFPNKILVFGEFWKNKLLKGFEHPDTSILMLGDFIFSCSNQQNVTKSELPDKENIVLIGSQKYMVQYYVEYINILSKTMANASPDWKIVVKLHPAEPEPEKYYELRKLKNVEVLDIKEPLMPVLLKSKIQVSVYSTTLYDSIGFDVMNYSLQNFSPYSDYAKEMLDNNVALAVELTDNPVEQYLTGSRINMNREFLYAPVNYQLMNELLS